MLNITDLQKEQTILPVFRLGFRAFFLFGSIFAVLSIAAWLLFLQAKLYFSPLNNILWWHGHEMLFGFVSSIIVGFLLTAVQNWTNTPGVRGRKLVALFLLWLSARLLIAFPLALSKTTIMFIDLAFFPVAALFLGLQLFRVRQYRNMIFIPLLLLMTVSNLLTYLPQFGFSTSLINQGLYSMVMLIVLLIALLGGRVIPMFTANATGTVKVLPLKWLELSSLFTLFLLYLVFLFGLNHYQFAFAIVFLFSSILHLYRWFRWRPWITLKVPLLWSLHLTLFFIPFGLALLALYFFTGLISLSTAMHSLTVGAMGGMILAMMSRVSLGHTGRALRVNGLMQLAFMGIIFSAYTRSLLITLLPFYSSQLWLISGILWCAAFSAFLWIYFPILTSPRLDGRPG